MIVHPDITANDVYRFTCGDCHIFASRLARITTHWMLATFVRPDDDRFDPGQSHTHAFCVLPDGRCADIEGIRSEAEFRHHWGETDPIKTWTSMRALIANNGGWSRPTMSDYSYRRARELAPIIARMGGVVLGPMGAIK